MERKNIVISGFGGQGVIFTGRVIAEAALIENKRTTFFPSYGAEMRGGTAHCSVIVDDNEIPSPIFRQPNTAIILNEPSAVKFFPRLVNGSVIVVNSSLVSGEIAEGERVVIRIPAAEIARAEGNERSANLVCLGCLMKASGMFNLEIVNRAVKEVLGPEKISLLDLNLASLQRGYEWLKK